jgi:Phage Terminase
MVGGRQSGKTSKLAAPIALFETFRDHGLPPGQEAYVMLLAPTIAQARIALRSIRNYLRGSKILSKRIVRTTKDEIVLDHGIIIGCYASTYDGVRGRIIVAAICDEMAFWPHEETSANPEEEVIAALRPGMITVKNPKLIKISTPYAKQGLLWAEFQRRAELDFPVWQLPSHEMNPKISLSDLEREQRRGEEKYHLREYLAEFVDSVSGWTTPEILDPCIARGRRELPPVRDGFYLAALDPASRHNDFALAILHRSSDGKIIEDRVARRTGTKTAPLAFRAVLAEIKSILDDYGINSAVGDQFCSDVIRQDLLELGVSYEICTFGPQTRAMIFTNLKHLLVQDKIELLEDPEQLRQLRNLREERTDRGQIDVRPSGGMKDDLAVAIALAASELTKRPSRPLPFLTPTGELFFLPNPWTCERQAICHNFPRCMDAGFCQGFVDERLIG